MIDVTFRQLIAAHYRRAVLVNYKNRIYKIWECVVDPAITKALGGFRDEVSLHLSAARKEVEKAIEAIEPRELCKKGKNQ